MTGADDEAFIIDVPADVGVELLAVVLTKRIEGTARQLLAEHPKRELTLREVIDSVTTEVVNLARGQGMNDEFCDSLAAIVTDRALVWYAHCVAWNN